MDGDSFLNQPLNLQISPSELGKKMLAQALAPVRNDLDELRPKLCDYLFSETASSRQVIDHVFGAQGKLIRPAIFFLMCRILKYRGDHLFPIAAVCEYVHTASLLHDDVIDNSTMRRNKPTSNHIWGDEAAVLVGDLIYSTASEMMAATGSIEIVKTFASSIRKMSEGELLQLENLFNSDISEETYLRILKAKTGILIGACCKAAGILANASDSLWSRLEQFGQNLGMAFQLVDDALDYLSDLKTVGKDTLSDLKEGKVTMPILLLRNELTNEDKNRFVNLVNADQIDEKDINWISSLIKTHKTAEKTLEVAGKYTDTALGILRDEFPESEERNHLENVSRALLMRLN